MLSNARKICYHWERVFLKNAGNVPPTATFGRRRVGFQKAERERGGKARRE